MKSVIKSILDTEDHFDFYEKMPKLILNFDAKEVVEAYRRKQLNIKDPSIP